MESKFAPLMALPSELMKALNKVDNYAKWCQSQVGECDRALSDIDHLIELTRLDAVKMMRALHKRKELLVERRFYKDEVTRADIVMKTMPRSQDTHGDLNQTMSKLKDFEEQIASREFTPRVLFDIFEYSDEEKAAKQQRRQDVKKLGKRASKKALQMEEHFRTIQS